MNESLPKLTKAIPVSLKAHPDYSEKWLQGLLADDPSLLGLGDLALKDLERRQPRAGRLDMLLSDPDNNTRYEVEIQLGATDESHIIRAIEYWDIEKNRYPNYEHVAVLVAEDVTSRFLNVISLLNRSVPLIAIQMNAWDVGGQVTLTATKVLDLMPAAPDDEDYAPGPVTDRAFWAGKSSVAAMNTLDDILALIREATGDDGFEFRYGAGSVGVSRNGLADNFIILHPRKSGGIVFTELKMPRSDELTARMEEAGLERAFYDSKYGLYKTRLTQADLTDSKDLLIEIIQRASGLKPVQSDDHDE